MVFSSLLFLFAFLPAVLILYLLGTRYLRNTILLAASLCFYAWGEGEFVKVMLISIVGNYLVGLAIDRCPGRRSAAWVLVAGIVLNLGLLGFYKYANFSVSNLNSLFLALGEKAPLPGHEPVHLPIGISFFTFQAMSYIIDVYRKEVPANRNPFHIALYISLFPQLIAGPIVRYQEIARELVSRTFDLANFAEGARRFVIGLAKKVIIANQVAVVADRIFAIEGDQLTAGVAWLGVLCYTLQIYFDFSGYSDMAIGLGRMFGFHFSENFRYPYISRSIREFWQRWHISLSTWFRDYLYIPLGGNRGSNLHTCRNLLIVFLLCGFWHGASWNFVIWGLIHGLFLGLERFDRGRFLGRLPAVLKHAYVLFVAMVAWVFFRVESLPDALTYLGAMFGAGHGDGVLHHVSLYLDHQTITMLILGAIASTPIALQLRSAKERLLAGAGGRRWLGNGFEAVQLVAFAILLLASIGRLAAGSYNPFIYFRF